MHQRYLTLLLLIVCAGLFWLSPVSRGSAQSLQPAPAATLPSDTQLNTLLAARNWNGLQLAFSRPRDAVTYVRGLDWLKAKIFAGDGGLLLALIYARDLWLLGESAKKDELRGTAALMALYASELIWIDGAKCEDRSAPGHRLDQLITGRADTLRFLKTEPAELKQKIVDAAIALERRTAPFRRDDELVCRGGLAEISAGTRKGHPARIAAPAGIYRQDGRGRSAARLRAKIPAGGSLQTRAGQGSCRGAGELATLYRMIGRAFRGIGDG